MPNRSKMFIRIAWTGVQEHRRGTTGMMQGRLGQAASETQQAPIRGIMRRPEATRTQCTAIVQVAKCRPPPPLPPGACVPPQQIAVSSRVPAKATQK